MTKLLTSTGPECSLKNLSQNREVLLCSRNFKNVTIYVADFCKLWGIYIKKNVCKMRSAEACRRSAQHAAEPFIAVRHFEIICSQQISESFNLKRQICPTLEFMETCILRTWVYENPVVSAALLRTSQVCVCPPHTLCQTRAFIVFLIENKFIRVLVLYRHDCPARVDKNQRILGVESGNSRSPLR